jgi:hypothetical protein
MDSSDEDSDDDLDMPMSLKRKSSTIGALDEAPGLA